jgi:hypothetical protein
MRNLIHKLITNPIMEKAYETGMDTVTQILQENGYHNHNINVTIQKNPSQNGPQPSKN